MNERLRGFVLSEEYSYRPPGKYCWCRTLSSVLIGIPLESSSRSQQRSLGEMSGFESARGVRSI